MQTHRGRGTRWATSGFAALGLALSVGGCDPPPARAPNPTRPLDERRAIEVIRQAIQNEGEKPAPGRDIKLADGTPIHLDVSVEGHAYGIAYISLDDAQKLGSAIPPPTKK